MKLDRKKGFSNGVICDILKNVKVELYTFVQIVSKSEQEVYII